MEALRSFSFRFTAKGTDVSVWLGLGGTDTPVLAAGGGLLAMPVESGESGWLPSQLLEPPPLSPVFLQVPTICRGAQVA